METLYLSSVLSLLSYFSLMSRELESNKKVLSLNVYSFPSGTLSIILDEDEVGSLHDPFV